MQGAKKSHSPYNDLIQKEAVMIQISWQELKCDENLPKEKWGQAMKDGCFYLGIPELLKNNIPFTVQYAEELRKRDAYIKRDETQYASFATFDYEWKLVFPSKTLELANSMNEIAIEVLKKTLSHLSVPEDLWKDITGMIDNKCLAAFAINHYKPSKNKIGLMPHKDLGWITVLFINKLGLEKCNEDGSWEDIPPKEGYFVVHFGQAFEILVGSVNKLKACIHRVRHVEEERISFGTHLHHSTETDVFRLLEDGQIFKIGSHEDYKRLCASDFMKLQIEHSS